MSADDQQGSERAATVPAEHPPDELVEPLPGNLGKGLAGTLQDGELVETAARTSTGEALVVTDRRVLILKAGFVTGAGLFGVRARSIPYSRIAAVDLRLALLGGHLKVVTTGLPRPADATSFKFNNDENGVSFGPRRKPYMQRVAAIIVDKVRGTQVAPGPEPPGDLAAQLAELARVRDEGVLTDAEFEQVKTRLVRGH
ncbi:MAG TPA: hypothetical protein VKZ50_20305 [bacterium]|nr:hypothetical protein [bacterium]